MSQKPQTAAPAQFSRAKFSKIAGVLDPFSILPTSGKKLNPLTNPQTPNDEARIRSRFVSAKKVVIYDFQLIP